MIPLRLGESRTVPLTDGGRRDRALFGTLLGSAGLQLATVLGTLLSWPVVSRVLSPAEFGVFTVLTGFHALLGLMDFGVGAALSIRLADAAARKDDHRAGVLMAASILASGAAAMLVIAIGVALGLGVPWDVLVDDPTLTGRGIGTAVISLAVALGITVVGYLGFRVLFALQRGALATRLLVLSTVSSTTALLAVASLDAALHWYVLAALGTPAAVALGITAITLHRVSEPVLRPNFRDVSARDVHDLIGNSSWFWLVSLCAALGFQADSLIVSGALGAASAGVFAVVVRLSGLVNQTVQPSVLQLAPAFTEALAKGDLDWVRSRLRATTLVAGLLAGSMSVLMVFLAPLVVEVWLTPELVPPLGLLVAAAIWQTYILASEPMFLLIQAAGKVRVHAWMAIAMVLVNVPLSIAFTLAWGLSGPLWGSLAANVLCCGLPALWYVRRLLADLDQPEAAW